MEDLRDALVDEFYKKVQEKREELEQKTEDEIRQFHRTLKGQCLARPAASPQGRRRATCVVLGHIEIGDQEWFGFIVRAIDYGELIFEDDKPSRVGRVLSAGGDRVTS